MGVGARWTGGGSVSTAPAIPDADESAWLFDASRDYLEQLAVYKARRGATL